MHMKPSGFVICATCQQRLNIAVYSMLPGPEVPEEKITRLADPHRPYFSVMCNHCGHFMISSPYLTQNKP